MIAELRERVVGWVSHVFGVESLMNRTNRAARVVEEAVELAQAEGCTEELIRAIVTRAYSRPVGEPHQEGAGVFFTLLAWSEAAGVDLEKALQLELLSVHAKPAEHFRAKQREKFEQGTDLITPV